MQHSTNFHVGRVSTFLDIYFERDLKKGIITEQEVQELVDHFTMKLRMVKFARIPSYNQLFSGDPVWATLDVAGTGVDGRSMVTKSDFRFLHTLENMGPAPEPNLTVLYSSRLPEAFKDYAARISIDTSSIQYENDDAMKPVWGDDYAICCCVSATQTGKEMQFFGARANLAKCLLYAINGGVDEKTGQQVGPDYKPITSEYLDYDEVMEKYDKMMDWLVDIYVNTLNLIQYNEAAGKPERQQLEGEYRTGHRRNAEYSLPIQEAATAPGAVSQTISLPDGGRVTVALEDFKKGTAIPIKTYTKWLDYKDTIKSLAPRHRRPGDYLTINERGGRKKLKDTRTSKNRA